MALVPGLSEGPTAESVCVTHSANSVEWPGVCPARVNGLGEASADSRIGQGALERCRVSRLQARTMQIQRLGCALAGLLQGAGRRPLCPGGWSKRSQGPGHQGLRGPWKEGPTRC